MLGLEIKKAWEFLLLPIPEFRPSHCPRTRISNAASPRQVIIYISTIPIQKYGVKYNLPTQTLRCTIAVYGFKVAKFELTDDNVRKRLSLWQVYSQSPRKERMMVYSALGFHKVF